MTGPGGGGKKCNRKNQTEPMSVISTRAAKLLNNKPATQPCIMRLKFANETKASELKHSARCIHALLHRTMHGCNRSAISHLHCSQNGSPACACMYKFQRQKKVFVLQVPLLACSGFSHRVPNTKQNLASRPARINPPHTTLH